MPPSVMGKKNKDMSNEDVMTESTRTHLMIISASLTGCALFQYPPPGHLPWQQQQELRGLQVSQQKLELHPILEGLGIQGQGAPASC